MPDPSQPIEKKDALKTEKDKDAELVIGALRTSEFIRDDTDPIAAPSMERVAENSQHSHNHSEEEEEEEKEEDINEAFYDVANNLEIKVPIASMENSYTEPNARFPQEPDQAVDAENQRLPDVQDKSSKSAETEEIDDEGLFQVPADPLENQFREPVIPMEDWVSRPPKPNKKTKEEPENPVT
ncbi:MAG: hypothetical protein LLG09_06170 [Negativicutes bacterium]|nr:hypothetical protein [Negativicutes bacterium]